jgi:cysteine desulfurase/selenocysteine lyase
MNKSDFPILNQTVHGKPLVYLDSSASSQKPQCVIDAISEYYQNDHANIHRGVYELSARATKLYENTRKAIQQFINAKHAHEIIFVRGATEGINLVAQSFGRTFFKKDDEIIISAMEHHSNIVPWQMLNASNGTKLKIIPVLENGELDLDAFEKLFSSKTKLLALTHASNVLGTINPIQKMIEIAHAHNVPVLIDGAQAFPHMSVDVQALDADFYVLSSHKAYGPTGVGVLYAKTKHLDNMPPYHGGGDMIESVSFETFTPNVLPHKFEAGTPNIAGVIGFGAALEFLKKFGMKDIVAHEQELLKYATEKLSTIPNLTIIGKSKNKLGVISFVMSDVHPHDIATILDREGIAVRAGHHCAMPLIEFFKLPATVRVSFGIYNSREDVDALIAGLQTVRSVFHV